MNSEQIAGIIRGIVSTIAGICIAYGIGDSESWLAITSGIVALATLVWSLVSNTNAAAIRQVANDPDVHKIIVNPTKIFVTDSPKVVAK